MNRPILRDCEAADWSQLFGIGFSFECCLSGAERCFGLLSAALGKLLVLQTSFSEHCKSAECRNMFGVESDRHFEGFGSFEGPPKSEQRDGDEVVSVRSVVLKLDGIEGVIEGLSGVLSDEHAAGEAQQCLDVFSFGCESFAEGIGGGDEVADEQECGAESEVQVRVAGG